MRRLRRTVNASVAQSDKRTQKPLEKLGDAVFVTQFDTALGHGRKRRKRAKVLMEEFRASEGSDALFMSPTNIHRAQELQTRREREKAQLQHDQELRRQEKADLKSQKAEEDRKKRVERAAAAAARTTATAQKKAAATEAREAKKTQKRLQNDSRISKSMPRGRPKKQPEDSRPEATSEVVQSEEPCQGRLAEYPEAVERCEE